MDRKKKKKIQSARVIMTNIFMGLSVIAIVFVLMLVAMGFSFSENGGLEQSGLLQISSRPSGATVEIDGETQFSRTEISKMLSSGQHHVKISKSGYDSWESDLDIDAGLFTHVDWVRLFPLNPEVTDVANFKQARLISFSTDRKNLLYSEQNSANLYFINLQNKDIKKEKISLATILGVDKDIAKTANISVTSWNDAGNKVIILWTQESGANWILADLEKPENSINLTAKFGVDFSKILISNDSASKLWGVEAGNLHVIDITNSTISAAVATGVTEVANNKDVVAYIATVSATPSVETPSASTVKQTLNVLKEGETGPTVVADFSDRNIQNATISMGTYWSEEWLAYSLDKEIFVLGGKYPSFEKPTKDSLKSIVKRELNYAPTMISHDPEQRIIVFGGETHLTTVDTETKDYYDINLPGNASINWLDDYILWQNEENKIIIRDFDGNNRRELISKTDNQLPICLTENNKWLYYFDVIQEQIEKETETVGEDGLPTTTTETSQTIKYVLKREKLNI